MPACLLWRPLVMLCARQYSQVSQNQLGENRAPDMDYHLGTHLDSYFDTYLGHHIIYGLGGEPQWSTPSTPIVIMSLCKRYRLSLLLCIYYPGREGNL